MLSDKTAGTLAAGALAGGARAGGGSAGGGRAGGRQGSGGTEEAAGKCLGHGVGLDELGGLAVELDTRVEACLIGA